MILELAGYVDVASALVVGWAMLRSDRERIVEIIVEVQGEVAARLAANQDRQDLRAAFGSGGHGFEVDISAALKPGENLVRVKFAESGDLLQRGEFRIFFDGSPPLVLKGVDGWLFLRNDSNNVLAKMSGENNFSERDLRCFLHQHRMRTSYIEALGAKYHVVVTPEKHVIYCDMGGGAFEVAADRAAVRIADRMQSARLMNYRYLLAELTAGKSSALVYYKTDTHLSWEGRRILTDYLGKALNLRSGEDQWFILQEEMSGNLGSKVSPPVLEKMTTRAPITDQIEYFLETISGPLSNAGSITGNISVSRNPWAANPGSKLYLFGTSGAYTSAAAMHTLFEYVLFVWSNAIDLELVRTWSPDYVVWLATERMLSPTSDDLGFSTVQHEALTTALKRIGG